MLERGGPDPEFVHLRRVLGGDAALLHRGMPFEPGDRGLDAPAHAAEARCAAAAGGLARMRAAQQLPRPATDRLRIAEGLDHGAVEEHDLPVPVQHNHQAGHGVHELTQERDAGEPLMLPLHRRGSGAFRRGEIRLHDESIISNRDWAEFRPRGGPFVPPPASAIHYHLVIGLCT